jgi:hypothetical protein
VMLRAFRSCLCTPRSGLSALEGYPARFSRASLEKQESTIKKPPAPKVNFSTTSRHRLYVALRPHASLLAAACGLRGCLAGLAASLDSAAGLNRATHLGALAVDLADGAASAEVREGRHVEVERLILALGVADTREVAVDVEEVVPVGLWHTPSRLVRSRKGGHALRLQATQFGYTVRRCCPPRRYYAHFLRAWLSNPNSTHYELRASGSRSTHAPGAP